MSASLISPSRAGKSATSGTAGRTGGATLGGRFGGGTLGARPSGGGATLGARTGGVLGAGGFGLRSAVSTSSELRSLAKRRDGAGADPVPGGGRGSELDRATPLSPLARRVVAMKV
jgi:hypothetical protein